MKIVFFNHWHNGDIHVSRGFVRKIMEKILKQDPSASFVYSHKNPSNLLLDIPNLGFDSNDINNVDMHDSIKKINNTIYINTWYAQQHHKYMNRYGMTMDCLYSAFNDNCKQLWGFVLSDITNDFSTFFPIIDYSKFEIGSSKVWLSNHQEQKIFVANGHALSGQAYNVNMTPIIIQLAQKYTNKTFILSNKETNDQLPSNVLYSSSIINKSSPSDLNENSFLSSYCNVIIGRSSGASTFAMTQQNLFQRAIKILYFTNIVPTLPNKFWADTIFRDQISYSANIICTNEPNVNNIYNIIDSHIL